MTVDMSQEVDAKRSGAFTSESEYQTGFFQSMGRELRTLCLYRELLITLVIRDLKDRYKNSVVGFLWSFITPLMTVAVLTFAFTFVMGIRIHNYGAYIFSTILAFTFFQQSLMDAAQCILQNSSLIKKVFFPREILPLAIIISNFIHFALGLVVFFVYLLVIWTIDPRVVPFQATSVYLPIVMIFQFCLTTGCGLYVAAINTFFEDTKYILSIVLYLFMYLCPVIVFVEQFRYSPKFPESVCKVLYELCYLNPMGAFLIAYRKLLLAPPDLPGVPHVLPLEWKYVWIAGAVSIFVLFSGYNFFNKKKWDFVER